MRLAGWLFGSLASYLACWMGGGWLIGLTACLAGRLSGGAGRLVIWLAICLAGCVGGCLVIWLFGWLGGLI